MLYIIQISPDEMGEDNIRVVKNRQESLDRLAEREESNRDPFTLPELGIQPVESTDIPVPRYDPSVQ